MHIIQHQLDTYLLHKCKEKKFIQYDAGEQRLCCVLLADNQCQKFPQATIYYK